MFSLLTRHREGRTLPFIQYIATMAAVDAIQEGADDALIAAGAKGHRKGTGTAVDAKIKWPNDLYSGGREDRGRAVHVHVQRRAAFDVVVGVGINLDNDDADDVRERRRAKAPREGRAPERAPGSRRRFKRR
jgi:biotin--protein ligase